MFPYLVPGGFHVFYLTSVTFSESLTVRVECDYSCIDFLMRFVDVTFLGDVSNLNLNQSNQIDL